MARHRKSSGSPQPTSPSVERRGSVVNGATEYLAGSGHDRIEPGEPLRPVGSAIGNESQVALAESEERYRSLVRAAGAIVWTTSAEGKFIEPQPGWEEYTGQSFAAYCNWGGMEMIHLEDLPLVSSRWGEATEQCIPFEAEYRLWHASSHRHRWCEVRGVPLLDLQGAVREWVGTITDIDERKSLAQERECLLERERVARHCSEHALRRLARLQMVTAVLSGAITDDGIVRAVVQEGLGTIGANIAFVARLNEAGDALELLHAGGVDEQAWQQFQRIPLEAPVPLAEAVRTLKPLWLGSTEERIERYPNLSGEYAKLPTRFWVSVPLVVEGRAVGGLSLGFEGGPVLDEGDQGYILALAGQCAQAMERVRLYHLERKARAEAEEGRRRSEFLAGVSELLAGTLDYEAVLAQLARLAVPSLGDWCAVDVLGEDGQIKRLAVAHTDPDKVQWGYELQRRFPLDPQAVRGVVNVLRTGQSELYSEIPDALLMATARNPEHLAALREVGFSSAMIVPLSARGRTLGAITLVMAESGRRYGKADLHLAEDLARRAGLAVDNARLYDAEQRARKDAERANRVKDDFLAVLSHELRTPLNPIIGWTQMLRRGKLSPTAQAEALEVIERNAKLQNQLIEDLLDVSRIEQGKFSHQPQPLVPSTVVHSAIEAVRSTAQAAQVALTIEVPEDLPEIEADPTRLSQVVWNLLINAVKFTPPLGRVEVRLMRIPDGVRLVVCDTGIGIAPEFLPHLFERFRQADASSTRKQGGLGLGLFIVHHIVELHGGRVWAESEGEGQGSTFTVELPVAKGV